MRLLEGQQRCDCGHEFSWRYCKREIGELVFKKMDELVLNCMQCTPTMDEYVLELRCPHCARRQFVSEKK